MRRNNSTTERKNFSYNENRHNSSQQHQHRCHNVMMTLVISSSDATLYSIATLIIIKCNNKLFLLLLRTHFHSPTSGSRRRCVRRSSNLYLLLMNVWRALRGDWNDRRKQYEEQNTCLCCCCCYCRIQYDVPISHLWRRLSHAKTNNYLLISAAKERWRETANESIWSYQTNDALFTYCSSFTFLYETWTWHCLSCCWLPRKTAKFWKNTFFMNNTQSEISFLCGCSWFEFLMRFNAKYHLDSNEAAVVVGISKFGYGNLRPWSWKETAKQWLSSISFFYSLSLSISFSILLLSLSLTRAKKKLKFFWQNNNCRIDSNRWKIMFT